MTGGIDSAQQYVLSSETIDLTATNPQCLVPDYPIQVDSSSGGLLNNQVVLVCGGYRMLGGPTDLCYKIGSEQPAAFLNTARTDSASIVWQHEGKEVLWISGGEAGFNFFNDQGEETRTLASTEFVSDGLTFATSGPDLPKPLSAHCMVRMGQDEALLIGGVTVTFSVFESLFQESSQTYFYSTLTEWTEGPKLTFKRQKLTCGLLTDVQTKEEIVVITGGFPNQQTELMFLQDNPQTWTIGASMLTNPFSGTGVSTASKKSFIVLGIITQIDIMKTIYRFQCHNRNCEWSLMEQQLEMKRRYPVALLIPDHIYSGLFC